MDGWIVLGLGVFFILAGIGSYIWGRREMESYYAALTARMDVREFVERTPFRPEPEALKIGGYISASLGIVLCGLAFVLF